MGLLKRGNTVCPSSRDPFYKVTYCIKWIMTSWTDVITVKVRFNLIFSFAISKFNMKKQYGLNVRKKSIFKYNYII